MPPYCRVRPALVGLNVALATVGSTEAVAQLDDVIDEKMSEQVFSDPPSSDEGWRATARIGATFFLNHNDNVVGTDDGLTLQLGGVLSAEASYQEGPHRWENELSIQQTQTQTPQLDRFVKSLDQLDLITTYNYRFEDIGWLGLFAKALLNTQIFDGEIVAAEVAEVRRPGAGTGSIADTLPYDGANRRFLDPGDDDGDNDSLRLTGTFEPLNLRQSVGLFAEPLRAPRINLLFKVGFGAQEIITQGGDVEVESFEEAFTFTNAQGNTVAGNRVVVVRALEDTVLELGAEAQIGVKGELVEATLSYYLSLNAFQPAFTTSDVDRDFGEAINLRLKAGASVKLTEVLSIEYLLNVLRIPATTEDFQVQNGLLISAGFDLI